MGPRDADDEGREGPSPRVRSLRLRLSVASLLLQALPITDQLPARPGILGQATLSGGGVLAWQVEPSPARADIPQAWARAYTPTSHGFDRRQYGKRLCPRGRSRNVDARDLDRYKRLLLGKCQGVLAAKNNIVECLYSQRGSRAVIRWTRQLRAETEARVGATACSGNSARYPGF
jgi:hypothetical protein